MSGENKAVIRRYYREVWEQGELGVIDELFAPDVELHLAGVPEDPFGPAPLKQLAAMAKTAWLENLGSFPWADSVRRVWCWQPMRSCRRDG